jgi:hypothetical protein
MISMLSMVQALDPGFPERSRVMRRVSLCVAVLVVAGCATLVAQTRPDFTGTWTFVADRSVTDAAVGTNIVRSAPPFGAAFSATQDAGGLTIQIAPVSAQLQPPRSTVYKFDGTEVRTTTPATGTRPEVQSVSTAAWTGTKLVITTSSTMTLRGESHVSKADRAIWIAADGTLIVETTSTLDGIVAPPLRAVYRKG